MSNETRFDSIEDGIKAIARGEMVICVDDEDRENEGDLICAAEKITPEMVNFMAVHARGGENCRGFEETKPTRTESDHYRRTCNKNQ